jgi:thioredoxin-like negative regulator of GroEL
MRFFSAALQGKTVSWAEVVEQGLQAALGETVVPSMGLASHVQAPKGRPVTKKPAVAPVASESSKADFSDDAPAGCQEGMDDDDSEEAFSIRTRSMAEVLAEQGDIAGALDIFHELVQNVSDEEKNSLEARIAELATRMNAPAPTESKTEEKAAAPGEESKRLVSLLESLAERLEDRAR